LTAMSGAGVEDFERYAVGVVARSLEEGLAWFAVDVDSGARVGFCIAHDHTPPPSVTVPPSLAPALGLLELLAERYAGQRGPIAPGEVVEISMTGAEVGVDGLGVASALERHALGALAARGFSRAVTCCTSPVTAALAEHLGFEAISSIEYREFVWRGEQIYAGRGRPGEAAIFYELSLPLG